MNYQDKKRIIELKKIYKKSKKEVLELEKLESLDMCFKVEKALERFNIEELLDFVEKNTRKVDLPDLVKSLVEYARLLPSESYTMVITLNTMDQVSKMEEFIETNIYPTINEQSAFLY